AGRCLPDAVVVGELSELALEAVELADEAAGVVGGRVAHVAYFDAECLMKVPARISAIACRSSSSVFITIGPYHATGSSIGLPETSRNRMPCSPAWTVTSSPRSNRRSERLATSFT